MIVPFWGGGIGSEIHVLTQSLSYAINFNRILIIKRLHTTLWGDPDFCDSNNQSILCYLQPITNCSVSDEDVKKAYNRNIVFVSSHHALFLNKTDVENHSTITYIVFPHIYNRKKEILISLFY